MMGDHMLFEDRLERAARLVEGELEAVFSEMVAGTPERLLAAMRHGVLGGGKRLRPFLLMASAELFGIVPARSVRAAAALECVHCYSLVHDDLPAMDDDDLRRGKPTVHVAFDEATAILAGDGLLTLAFEIAADARTHSDAGVRTALIHNLAHAAGARGMAGGQMLDLQAETQMPDEAGIKRLQAMKTGALLRFAVEAGALLGAAPAKDRACLTAYGMAIGAAFQVADDILDVEGSSVEIGKATAKDADAGKATLVGLLGVDPARQRLAQLVDEAIGQLSQFDHRADPLREAAQFVMTRRK